MALFRSPRYVEDDRRTAAVHQEAKQTSAEIKRRLEAIAAEDNPLEAFTRSLLDARNRHEMFGSRRR
jgi:hypothetical protein